MFLYDIVFCLYRNNWEDEILKVKQLFIDCLERSGWTYVSYRSYKNIQYMKNITRSAPKTFVAS